VHSCVYVTLPYGFNLYIPNGLLAVDSKPKLHTIFPRLPYIIFFAKTVSQTKTPVFPRTLTVHVLGPYAKFVLITFRHTSSPSAMLLLLFRGNIN